MRTVLLDSHVVHWWSAEPEKLSPTATRTIERADELAVASITWFELAWLAAHDRIVLAVPIRSWLDGLAADVRSVGTRRRSPQLPSRSRRRFRGTPRTG